MRHVPLPAARARSCSNSWPMPMPIPLLISAPQSRTSILVACLVVVYLVWGSTYLAIHMALDGFPPLLMAGVRNLVAGPLVLGWLFWRGAPWPTSRQWCNGVLMGIMMMGLGNGCVCLAEQLVPSGIAALFVGGAPVFAILFGLGFGARPRLFEWLGVLLGLAGMLVLNFDARAASSPAGIVLLVTATASWSLASVLQPRLNMPRGGVSAGVQMVGGGVFLFAASLLRGEHLAGPVPPHSWFALAYLIVFGSILAYTAFVYVINHSRPALATSYAYVNPVVAVGLGAAFAGERASGAQLLGMAVILAGVALVVLGHSRQHR
jgi:drug/metabolite transporter (DMT)-like permease